MWGLTVQGRVRGRGGKEGLDPARGSADPGEGRGGLNTEHESAVKGRSGGGEGRARSCVGSGRSQGWIRGREGVRPCGKSAVPRTGPVSDQGGYTPCDGGQWSQGRTHDPWFGGTGRVGVDPGFAPMVAQSGGGRGRVQVLSSCSQGRRGEVPRGGRKILIKGP